MEQLSATWHKIWLGLWTIPHNRPQPCCSKSCQNAGSPWRVLSVVFCENQCVCMTLVPYMRRIKNVSGLCSWIMSVLTGGKPWYLINKVAFFHFQKWLLGKCVLFFTEGEWRRKSSCNFSHFSEILYMVRFHGEASKRVVVSCYRLEYWNYLQPTPSQWRLSIKISA